MDKMKSKYRHYKEHASNAKSLDGRMKTRKDILLETEIKESSNDGFFVSNKIRKA